MASVSRTSSSSKRAASCLQGEDDAAISKVIYKRRRTLPKTGSSTSTSAAQRTALSPQHCPDNPKTALVRGWLQQLDTMDTPTCKDNIPALTVPVSHDDVKHPLEGHTSVRHRSVAVPCATVETHNIEATPARPLSEADLASAGGISATRSNTNESIGSANSAKTKEAAYRNTLARNGIYVSEMDDEIPKAVLDHAMDIISNEQNHSGLSDQRLVQIKHRLSKLEPAPESTLTAGMHTLLFPDEMDYETPQGKPVFVVGGDIIWTSNTMPYNADFATPVAQPKPDRFYGFSEHNFGPKSQAVMGNARLANCAGPGGKNWWPFLFIEYKSRSCFGSSYHAENQAAGAGALGINILRMLLRLAQPGAEPINTDTIHFSVVINNRRASLWIHWFQEGRSGCNNGEEDADDESNLDCVTMPGPYMSAEIETYEFRKLQDVARFHAHLRNIVNWGQDKRLSMVKRALRALVPRLAGWLHEDAATVALRKIAKRASGRASSKSSGASSSTNTSSRSSTGGDPVGANSSSATSSSAPGKSNSSGATSTHDKVVTGDVRKKVVSKSDAAAKRKIAAAEKRKIENKEVVTKKKKAVAERQMAATVEKAAAVAAAAQRRASSAERRAAAGKS